MICPKCDEGILITENTDSRQFWSDEYMVCNKCQTEYTLKTVYDEGTRLVTSQELLDENGKNVWEDEAPDIRPALVELIEALESNRYGDWIENDPAVEFKALKKMAKKILKDLDK